jgi:16S rRNA (guanine966-N2)-methyltransferase
MSTRISGGFLKGRVLPTPKGILTRPTSSRIREALFSMLGSLDGLDFLDLYAGSGSVGIEALSRGAAKVHWVEYHIKTANSIMVTLNKWNLLGQVYSEKAEHYLESSKEKFDVVFVDPPFVDKYPSCDWKSLLAPGGRLVLQYPKRLELAILAQAFKIKKYGESHLAIIYKEDL